jgi:hypothetical protein
MTRRAETRDKVEGHGLAIGGISVRGRKPIAARCECGATSHPLKNDCGARRRDRERSTLLRSM